MGANANVKPIFKSKAGAEEYFLAYDRALTLWPVPFKEHDVLTSFGPTHVIVSGNETSPPLVLLHSAQASSTMWFSNIQGLSARHRVYAIDFILETGKSIPTRQMSSKQELAQWLLEVFHSFDLQKPSVVGISRGAWNALVLAILFPRRIDKLVLLSPAQAFTPISNIGFLFSTIACTFFPSDRNIRSMARRVFFKPSSVPSLFLEQYRCALKYFNIWNGINVPPSLFEESELRSLPMACLLLIGDHDVINSIASLEKAKALIPNVETEIVSEGGHILTMDQPEVVNRRIIEFLLRQ